MNRHFRFVLKDEFIRGMNRNQYKAASHWVRWTARFIDSRIVWDRVQDHFRDVMLYGRVEFHYEDMLL